MRKVFFNLTICLVFLQVGIAVLNCVYILLMPSSELKDIYDVAVFDSVLINVFIVGMGLIILTLIFSCLIILLVYNENIRETLLWLNTFILYLISVCLTCGLFFDAYLEKNYNKTLIIDREYYLSSYVKREAKNKMDEYNQEKEKSEKIKQKQQEDQEKLNNQKQIEEDKERLIKEYEEFKKMERKSERK